MKDLGKKLIYIGIVLLVVSSFSFAATSLATTTINLEGYSHSLSTSIDAPTDATTSDTFSVTSSYSVDSNDVYSDKQIRLIAHKPDGTNEVIHRDMLNSYSDTITDSEVPFDGGAGDYYIEAKLCEVDGNGNLEDVLKTAESSTVSVSEAQDTTVTADTMSVASDPPYHPGDTIGFSYVADISGDVPTDITIEATVEGPGYSGTETLMEKNEEITEIKLSTGKVMGSFEWDTNGLEPGEYTVTTTYIDNDGNIVAQSSVYSNINESGITIFGPEAKQLINTLAIIGLITSIALISTGTVIRETQ